MSTQALARHTDPETSHIAASACDAGNLQELVLRTLKKGPATMHDVALATGVSLVSVSPRFAQLRRKGFLVDSGLRDTTSRMPRTIWRLA